MEIRVDYDTEVDALSIRFKEPSGRVVTHLLSDKASEYIDLEPEDVALDFDETGKIVGMEVLSASKYFEAYFLSQANSKAMMPAIVGQSRIKIDQL